MGLHFGSRGPQVLEVQKQLNDYYSDPPLLVETSVYDYPTKQKVMRFQTDQALVADGDAGEITLALLRGDSIKVQVVPDPPAHIQADNQWICWASSLSSFMDATKDIVQFNDDEWVGVMKQRGVTGENDGLTPAGWDQIMRDTRMKGVLFTDSVRPVNSPVHPRKDFGADVLYNAVKNVGYTLVVYSLGASGGLAHTVLVWGAELNSGDEPHYFRVMDPWRVGKTTRTFGYFNDDHASVALIFKPKGHYRFEAKTDLPFQIPAQ